MDADLKTRNNKRSILVLFQVILVPLLSLIPVAVILIFVLGWEPSGRLTRGILYACLFLACVATGRWKFSLVGTGLTGKNIGRGFAYASIILVAGFIFMLVLQPPVGLVDITPAIWCPILFYLSVALAEEAWFRGLIFKALYEWRGALLSVFGSAALFGFMHVPMHGWEGLLYSLSIGLPYAVVRLRTNNIWGLIVVHWLTNLTDSFLLLSTTGLSLGWITLLHILTFSGVSVLILLLDRWLSNKTLRHARKMSNN